MRVLIAIDPGQSGAIAVRDASGTVSVTNMPATLRDIWEHLFNIDSSVPVVERQNYNLDGFYKERQHAPLGCIEDVGYHVQGNNASASCKFARGVGALEMALTGLCIPWHSVRPQVWMKHFGALPKDKTARKNRIKELVQRRLPHLKITLANADALAILIYCIEREDSYATGTA